MSVSWSCHLARRYCGTAYRSLLDACLAVEWCYIPYTSLGRSRCRKARNKVFIGEKCYMGEVLLRAHRLIGTSYQTHYPAFRFTSRFISKNGTLWQTRTRFATGPGP